MYAARTVSTLVAHAFKYTVYKEAKGKQDNLYRSSANDIEFSAVGSYRATPNSIAKVY